MAIPAPARSVATSGAAVIEPTLGGAAARWSIGRGRVAWIDGGSGALANQRVAKEGLTVELAWLAWILDGQRRVVFDEGRLGFAESEGIVDLLSHSRFADGLCLAVADRFCLAALLVGLVAMVRRRYPVRVEPLPGANAFQEYIEAVGFLLQRGKRVRLAAQLLLSGTRQRLGALARLDKARDELHAAEQALLETPTSVVLAEHAEVLRRLEERLREAEGEGT